MATSIEPADAVGPLVLALDIGSSGSRGGLYDATGTPLSGRRHKCEHRFDTTDDGGSVVDPDRLVAEITEIIDTVLAEPPPATVAAVAVDTFAMSLIGVGADGSAVTPCYTYADTRSAGELAGLRSELDEAEVQQRTGTRLHTSYLAPRLRWLRATDPATWARVRRWVSLPEYVQLQLIGSTTAGTSSAAWTGLLDRHTGRWDTGMLTAAGIDEGVLSAVADHHHAIVPERDVTDRWPALAEAAWLPGFADGIASNVGAGGVGPGTVVLSAATSGAVRVVLDHTPAEIPTGLWCYRIDDRRSLLGGALNDVGRAIQWLRDTLRLPGDEDLTAALQAPPAATTPLVLPFLTGERATGWAGSARAVLTGVSAAHEPVDLARGTVEGLALAYRRVFEQLVAVAGAPARVVCNGRAASGLPGVLDVIADVLGHPVEPVTAKRATLRGTALLALEVVAPDTPRAAVEVGDPATVHAERAEHYRGRAAEFERVYRGVVG